MSDNACELLTDFHTGDEPTGRYVFEKRSAFTSMKYRLDKLLPDITEYWRFHDFRTALASTLASRGMVSSDLIDDLLGHKKRGIIAHYMQADTAKLQRAALNNWADIVTGKESDNVLIWPGNTA